MPATDPVPEDAKPAKTTPKPPGVSIEPPPVPDKPGEPDPHVPGLPK